MQPDLNVLYEQMLRSRLFEEVVTQLWEAGEISGEMHLAIGEEAVSAGVVTQLDEGDALALDHRGTPQSLMRGISPLSLLLEFYGHPQGLCSGMGGHIHLFSREHLLASSGIVGASGPAAVGFAMANRTLRPGKIAVAFFGEGAANQGMMMESFNLASVWKLPVLFICKNNAWSITTPSESVTAGSLVQRAASFDIPAQKLDGSDVETVWYSVSSAIERARTGKGPSFFLMDVFRPEGHFLGDPLIRIARKPVQAMKPLAGPLLKSITQLKGGSLKARTEGILNVITSLGTTAKNQWGDRPDPLEKAREKMKQDGMSTQTIDNRVEAEISGAVNKAAQILKDSGEGTP